MTADNEYSVLIVDDSPEDRAAFRRFITQDRTRSYRFEQEDMGANGLERLSRTDTPLPDCLLLDYNLPDMSGIEFLAELQEQIETARQGRTPAGESPLPCAVVMLTGSGDEAAAVAAMKAGVQDYLVKGKLLPETLQQAVRNSIERFDLTRRLHDSEARLRLATEAAGIGTWHYEAQTGAVNGDARYRELLGLPAEGPLDSDTCLARVYEEDRARTAEALQSALVPSSSGRYSVEYRTLPYPEEGYRWLHSMGQVSFDPSGTRAERFVGTTLDITERKQIEEERERHAAQQAYIAETLQQSLLISLAPDTFDNLALHIEYRTALEEAMVGGDFADAFALDDTHIAFIVGDVTGKGLAAATYTAEIKFALRAFLRDSPEAAGAMGRLNRFLAMGQRLDANPHWQLVSLAVVVVDKTTGAITVCCAGAEAPLLIRHDRDRRVWRSESLEVMGPLLGLDEESRFRTHSCRMAPGEILVIATDGITEARAGRKSDCFGYERLAEASEQAAALPTVFDTAKFIVSSALHFAGGRQSDDICLLVLRYNGG